MSGAGVEVLQRHVAYGGRKGARAARRLKGLSGLWCRDKTQCQRYFSTLKTRTVTK